MTSKAPKLGAFIHSTALFVYLMRGGISVRYFGGKSRICKDIATILNENRGEGQIFLSPFVGGGWVEQYIKGPKVLVDKHKYLISMYLELQKGWLQKKSISTSKTTQMKCHI